MGSSAPTVDHPTIETPQPVSPNSRDRGSAVWPNYQDTGSLLRSTRAAVANALTSGKCRPAQRLVETAGNELNSFAIYS